jgi:hypothetical protein
MGWLLKQLWLSLILTISVENCGLKFHNPVAAQLADPLHIFEHRQLVEVYVKPEQHGCSIQRTL